jgi:hypothetical protein
MNEQYPDLKSKNKYDPFVYALEEPYIDTTQIDSSKYWFRIVVRPCFRLPYCFIFEKKNGKSFLTTKITNGDGAYYTGVLISTMRFPFGDTLYNKISSQLQSLNFWKLGKDTTCYGGFDGETWTFGDGFRVFDSSINDFCNQNDISYIEVQPTAGNRAHVTYYLLDNNYQYIVNGYDTSEREMFENTRVRVVPINKKWTFQYEKPNF